MQRKKGKKDFKDFYSTGAYLGGKSIQGICQLLGEPLFKQCKSARNLSCGWRRAVLCVSVLEKFCILEEEELECDLTVATATKAFLMEGKDK